MIRATGATWLNYACTFVFQILFAAAFGSSGPAAAFVIAYAAAASVAAIFVSTASTIAIPRLVTEDGRLSQAAIRLLAGTTVVVVFLGASTGLAAESLSSALAPIVELDPGQGTWLIRFSAIYLTATGAGGISLAILLAKGWRFLPAVSPAVPTLFAAVYLAWASEPTVTATFAALALGSLAQLALASTAAWRLSRSRRIDGGLQLRRIAALTAVQFALLGLLPLLQRLVAGLQEPAGAVRFDYAFRGTTVAQQLIIGGLLVTLLPDWAARRERGMRAHVTRAALASGFALAVASAVALVAAPAITAAAFERGSFRPEDTEIVAGLVRWLLPGFVAEGVGLVLVQAVVAAARNDVALKVGFTRLGLQAALTILLGSSVGASGVAIAYSVSMAVTLAMLIVIVAKLSLIRYENQMVVRFLAATTVTLLAAGMATVQGWQPPLGVGFILAAALFSALLLGLPQLVGVRLSKRLDFGQEPR